MAKTLRELGRVMGQAMAEMTAKGEEESWKPKEHVYYRITIAVSTVGHLVYGFTREIAGHDSTCCTMPDGKPRTITTTSQDGQERKVPYCLHSGTRMSKEEAMSLVRNGHGSVYKVIKNIQRLK